MSVDRFRTAGWIALLIYLSAPPANTFAQGSAAQPSPAAPQAMPSANEILDRYLQATGGRDAWKNLMSRISKGTIEVPGMNAPGTVEIREKAPDRMLAVFVIGETHFREGFNSKGGWSDDPVNGLRAQVGDELADLRRGNDFSPPADMRDLYKTFAVAGTAKVADREAYVLNATTENYDPDKLYFDTQTGLLIRQISQDSTPDDVMTIQRDYSDYREVDGVKLPFVIQQTNGQSQFTIKLAEIHHNLAFDDATFATPPIPSTGPPPRDSQQVRNSPAARTYLSDAETVYLLEGDEFFARETVWLG